MTRFLNSTVCDVLRARSCSSCARSCSRRASSSSFLERKAAVSTSARRSAWAATSQGPRKQHCSRHPTAFCRTKHLRLICILPCPTVLPRANSVLLRTKQRKEVARPRTAPVAYYSSPFHDYLYTKGLSVHHSTSTPWAHRGCTVFQRKTNWKHIITAALKKWFPIIYGTSCFLWF